ncbi:hypothetical protein FHP22_15630 (plasmid) [Acinetobacter indicus]|uniref:hypothetical protein n=1 Tax=Acinetobacter indicus TaxID=756892 RepID=UPI00126655B0|nr:hypothetical protein [Acinetobacter indicus]QFS18875.1 hypothetical protein FHP22_15630 [Acinetobacter indicus]
MTTSIESRSYKFPRRNTYPSAILVELLNGERITNAQMMEKLNCPHAATAISYLRDKSNWRSYLKDTTKPTSSGLGDPTREKEYWFDSEEIVELKANDPRIEKFLEANRKS